MRRSGVDARPCSCSSMSELCVGAAYAPARGAKAVVSHNAGWGSSARLLRRLRTRELWGRQRVSGAELPADWTTADQRFDIAARLRAERPPPSKDLNARMSTETSDPTDPQQTSGPTRTTTGVTRFQNRRRRSAGPSFPRGEDSPVGILAAGCFASRMARLRRGPSTAAEGDRSWLVGERVQARARPQVGRRAECERG